MSVVKDVRVVYVGPIPKERSGIGQDVPPHVVLEFRDEQGRRNRQMLPLDAEMVERISKYPDAPKD
jgi:hypothetical protein